MRADWLSKLFGVKCIHHNYLLYFHLDHSSCLHCRRTQIQMPRSCAVWHFHISVGGCAFEGRCWSKTVVCHISLNIQHILIKFTPHIYCMKILQMVKFDLICIMVATVMDKSLLTVNGFLIKLIPINHAC